MSARIKQVEGKVVNHLHQVTGDSKQSGVNRMSIIGSTAERPDGNQCQRYPRPSAIDQSVSDAIKLKNKLDH